MVVSRMAVSRMVVSSGAPPSGRESRAQAAQLTAFRELSDRVLAAGLLRRRYGFYWAWFTVAALALAGAWAGVVLLDHSWLQLILAGVLGVIFAQLGFLAHEASHRQIFNSPRWNEWTGRVLSSLLVGISYGWWMNKHSRHHANPNALGKDPDIESRAVAFTGEATDRRRRLGAWLAPRQGWLFIPLLLLEGLSLHVSSVRRVLSTQPVKHRAVEISFLFARIIGYVALVFWLLPPGMAAAFVGVQVAVFGLLLGGAFAPNHVGMPVVARGTRIDFLRRQVLMSRNIRGGVVVRFFMGGLQNQVEHHLFPSMPRPNLEHAREIVRDYCRQHKVAYTETTLWQAYGTILRYLNQVGLRHRDAFSCPLVQQYRT